MPLSTDKANQAETWEHLRREGPPAGRMELCPTLNWRYWLIAHAVSWAWPQVDRGQVVLDVSAGLGMLGQALQHLYPKVTYHATEHAACSLTEIKQRVPTASVVKWTYGEQSLRQALADATDTFEEEYPVVVLSHVIEHVEDYYGLLDEIWSLVATPGFLVVCAPYEDEHRTHYTSWNWKRLLRVLRQYGTPGFPLAVWPEGSWADMLVAVPKTPVVHPLRAALAAGAACAAPATPPSSLSQGSVVPPTATTGSSLSPPVTAIVATTDSRLKFNEHNLWEGHQVKEPV